MQSSVAAPVRPLDSISFLDKLIDEVIVTLIFDPLFKVRASFKTNTAMLEEVNAVLGRHAHVLLCLGIKSI